MSKKIVVIGAVAAGMSAAAKARRTDPACEISVYTDDQDISYAGCGLPYFVGGGIGSKEALLARTVEEFAKENIIVYTRSRVEEIRPASGKVVVRQAEKTFEDGYDRLIIATGARPFKPQMPGSDLDGVFPLRSLQDSLHIKEFFSRSHPEKIAIIGGGYIGLEMAENFVKLGCHVSIIEKAPHIIPNMDEDMAQILTRYLEGRGIEIHTGKTVLSLLGDQSVKGVSTDMGEIPADCVLLSIGVIPNSELAGAVGIELGAKNAIRVNSKMETNLENIYSAGDCATTVHLITGKEVYIPLGTTANKQGKVAGENAAGGNSFFKGVLGTGIARVLDMEVARSGLSEAECNMQGISYVSKRIKSRTAAGYAPESKEIHVKLIAEQDSGRLLGGQIVGYAGSAKRIDMLAAAMTLGATVEQLNNMDLAYAPPFSPVWDPILTALNQF
jgi:NADPH-dependent 2,4-dienoyl-CoA reductase/sulfur reductase-like enzyme